VASPRQHVSGPILPSTRPPGGFRATIKDAGLADLVQIKCEARARCIVRVSSGALYGYLYFDAGQIVHAVLGAAEGEGAALEILCWDAGNWDPSERPWPEEPSISTAWQGLLLRAAQMQDERPRSSRPVAVLAQPQTVRSIAPTPRHELPTLPKPGALHARAALAQVAQVAQAASTSVAPASTQSAARGSEESAVSLRPESFEHSARVDAEGRVLTGHGDSEELAALASYACRLGDIIGDLLAVGKARAVDAVMSNHATCLVFRDAAGDIVALKPRIGVDMARLRGQLKL
jgi:hypothetical protein